MHFKKKYILLLVFLLASIQAWAQKPVPLQHDFTQTFEQWAIENPLYQNTFIKPFRINKHLVNVPADSVIQFGIGKPAHKKSLISRKWLYEALYETDSSDFGIKADALFNFSFAREKNSESNYYTNTRGIRLEGHLGHEIFFESTFQESQASFPEYISDYIHSSNVSPGQGQARRFGNGGFDYAMSSGGLSFAPGKHTQISLGHGKHFIGHGYRTAFLSDNAFNYPYLQVDLTFKKLKYSRIMSLFMSDSIPVTPFGVREKRIGSFNILSLQAIPEIQISLFEGSIWAYPNKNQEIPLNYNAFNPIIFANTLINRNAHTSVCGLSAVFSIFKSLQMYGQIALNPVSSDSIKQNDKIAWQTGIKYFNAFTIGGLYLQAEYNKAGRYFISAPSGKYNYTHFNQSLGHILGENYSELVLRTNYTYKSLKFQYNFTTSGYGQKGKNWPVKSKQFISNYEYTVPILGSGPQTNTIFWKAAISYRLNAFSNRGIEIGYQSRTAKYYNSSYNSGFVFISFRTIIDNCYYDF